MIIAFDAEVSSGGTGPACVFNIHFVDPGWGDGIHVTANEAGYIGVEVLHHTE